MDDDMCLTELELDAIAELLNIGMGQATASLSQMVNEEVHLSVPSVELLTRQEAANYVRFRTHQNIAAIKQHFRGHFWGDALLLFPQEKGLELVRALIKEDVPLDMLTELEQDALIEVGNIILNACLSTLANLLSHELNSDLPTFMIGSAEEIFDANIPQDEERVMFMRMHLSLRSNDVDGYVAFILDIPAIAQFKQKIDDYLGQL
jgi:chemotaxis protein CheC